MEKVINPVRVKITEEHFHDVFCRIVYKSGSGKLTISDMIGPRKNGGYVGFGQIQDELVRELRFKKGWDSEKLETFFEIWNNYHLNTMHPECEHQRLLGWVEKAKEKIGDRGRERGEVFYKESEAGLLEKPCPICGYGYGCGWKRVEVPDWVLEFLGGLPESELVPAWA